jgi:phosphinothricin acetyltransferase
MEFRGKGVGTLLYSGLEKILKMQNVTNLYAAVSYREHEDETISHASPRFHLARGFRKVAHFEKCGYKFERWYDIVWYEKYICEHPEHPEDFIPLNMLKNDLSEIQLNKNTEKRDKNEYC